MSTTEWTIPDLLQLSGGYWSTCALHAGVKLDIFSVLEARRGRLRRSHSFGTATRAVPPCCWTP